jgi:predicted Rossmann-fold nucleotide-binding protein
MALLVSKAGSGSGFSARAGRVGTLDKVMEMMIWAQLRIHGLGLMAVNIGAF